MTYEKYMKYKIKYYKLKELEQKLIKEGKLKYDDIKPNTLQSGGSINNKCSKCKNAIQIAGSRKLCSNCTSNILNINQLTETPMKSTKRPQMGKELYNQLVEKQLQKGDELYNQLAGYDSSNHSEISDIDNQEILKYNNVNDNEPINNIEKINTDSESVLLSILNSSEN